MKRKEEQFCRDAFQGFLESQGHKDVKWVDVAQEDEPPDYYLWLDGDCYAVEITTLMEQVEIGDRKVSSQGIVATLWGLVDQVKDEANQKEFLHGAYVVGFAKPIEHLSVLKKQLKNDLLEYVQATQCLECAPEKIIFREGCQLVSIQKMHNHKTYIAKFGPSGGKWGGEMIDEITGLIEERIETKKEKLREIQFPKILLLYDVYLYADIEVYDKHLDEMSSLSAFHTVFVVPNDGPGKILHSENTSWCADSLAES